MEWKITEGMELRDWFAGMALCGITLKESGGGHITSANQAHFATMAAYLYADSMMEARKIGHENKTK